MPTIGEKRQFGNQVGVWDGSGWVPDNSTYQAIKDYQQTETPAGMGTRILNGLAGGVSGAIDKGAQMFGNMYANQFGDVPPDIKSAMTQPDLTKSMLPTSMTDTPAFQSGTNVGRGIAAVAPYVVGNAAMAEAQIPARLQALLPKSAGMIARLGVNALGHAAEGGIADAATASAIGDNPVMAGVGGAVTSGVMGALPTPGNKQIMYGDPNISLYATGSRNNEIDRLSNRLLLDERVNPDTIAQKESAQNVAKFVQSEIRTNMDAGMQSANLDVQKAVKLAERANNTKFIPIRKEQSDLLTQVAGKFGDRVSMGSTGDAIDASRELAKTLDDAYEAIQTAHKNTVDSVCMSVSGGHPDQFVVPDQVVGKLHEVAGKILSSFDALAQKGGTKELTSGERNIIARLAGEGADPNAAPQYTLQDLRDINGMLIRANRNKDAFILSKPYMTELQGAVRQSIRDAIEVAGEQTWGTQAAKSFVDIFDESSTKMAKAIDAFDEKVLGSITTAVKNNESEKVVGSLLQHPEWADLVIKRVADSGDPAAVARAQASMAKGIWSDAVQKATKTGRWDSQAFDQAADYLLQNPRIKDVVFGDRAPLIEEFRNLSRLYDLSPASYVPNSSAMGQAGIPFAENAINAQGAQSMGTAVATGNPQGILSSGMNYIFRKLGIENVAEHPEIMSEILTNPSLLNLNNQALREGLNSLKATGYATISDKAAAQLKRGLAASNPSLFRAVFAEGNIRKFATSIGGATGGQFQQY